MTNVVFNKKELSKEIELNKETIEKISLFGTPVERENQEEIEIEIFPNRPDLISLQGFMRSFKSFLGKEKGLKKYKIKKSDKKYHVIIEKEVKEIRPYTSCAIVKKLKIDDKNLKEIINLQEKLHLTLGRNRKKVAIGVYPLDKISFPIKYTAKKPQEISFKPLDYDKEINGNQILLRHPVGKRYAELLKGLDKYPIFIDSNNKILSMPPIINSEEIGRINQETKEIFIECSGTDIKSLDKALNIIVTTLADMGGEIHEIEIIDNDNRITPNLKPEKMKISLGNVNKLLGLNLKENEISNLLMKMGHDYSSGRVEIPAWRTDILHEVDLIEDIAIAYGYDKISSEIPNISTNGEELNKNILKRKISEILIGLGSLEISTYHLIKENESNLSKLKKPLELEDSKTEYKILRPNLFIPLLRIYSENQDVEYPQKLFEIGRVFLPDQKEETKIKEQDNLILGISPGNFTEIKQNLDYIMKNLSLDYKLEHGNHQDLISGRNGKIIVNEKEVGYIGELHPSSLKKFGAKMPLAVLEINLDEILK